MSRSDPVPALEDDVSAQLAYAATVDKQGRALRSKLPHKARECLWTAEELTRLVDAAAADVDDLEAALRQARSNAAVVRLTKEQLQHRAEFTASARTVLAKMRGDAAELQRDATAALNAPRENRAELTGGSAGKSSGAGMKAALQRQRQEENAALVQDHASAVRVAVHKQDDMLDGLSTTVKVLHAQADAIGNELDDQNDALNHMEVRVDDTLDKLKRANRKMERVYKAETGRDMTPVAPASTNSSWWPW